MRRLRFVLPVLLCLATAAVALATVSSGADVVVHFPNGRTIFRHTTFDTPSIDAVQELQRAGLTIETNGTGAQTAVCSIEGVGCPSSDCFCACKGSGACNYWAYWRSENGQWNPSNQGAGAVAVTNGALDGWRWGDGPPIAGASKSPSLIQPQSAAYAGADWLRTQQRPNGAFATGTYSVGITLDAILGGAAADAAPGTWRAPGGRTALEFLATEGAGYTQKGAREVGKFLAAVVAANGNPYDFGGRDLVAITRNTYRNGRFGLSNWDQAWAILGLTAVGESIPVTATRQLAADHGPDGGWSLFPGDPGDVDSTGIVLQALAAAHEPVTGTAILSGTAFLHAQQNSDGGFPATAGVPSNGPSTAMAVGGLLATGQNPLAPAWTRGGKTPLDYMLTLQSPVGGFAGTAGPNDIQATGQSLPALMGRPFPLHGRRTAAERALAWLRPQQAPNGQFGFGAGSTIDALFAIAADHQNPATWRSSAGHSPLDYLATQAITYTNSGAAATGKLIVGLYAAGVNPQQFGGVDLPAKLASYDQGNGRYGGATAQAWATLALRVLGESTTSAASELRSQQLAGGGWSSGFDPGADTNTTALAMQALVAAQEPITSTAIVSATAYLHDAQSLIGGFPYTAGDMPDANSTATVVQALTATGGGPDGLGWTTHLRDTTAITLTAQTPVRWLLAQQSTSGAFTYGGSDSDFATLQTVPALLGQPLPIAPTRLLFLPLVERGR
ncbi:MAG: prenyltransferase/squalene oxidase repeat-containing protein [Anaerolineae bacterium]